MDVKVGLFGLERRQVRSPLLDQGTLVQNVRKY